METETITNTWVSFCMSTYKRPLLLKRQLELILLQTLENFEVIISDNDPKCSAKEIVEIINDSRLKYFPNIENIGMVASFNKSIQRASSDYVIMITDDDPVIPNMLEEFYQLAQSYPNYGIYIGCCRSNKAKSQIEVFDNQNFLYQILHPSYTSNLLWSSSIMKRSLLLNIGGMPNYGSPHLADHVMIALCGCDNGGVIINKMYSHLTAHDNNFSKGNIHLYYTACKEFYDLISKRVRKEIYIKNGDDALLRHIERWFLVGMFSLKNYYTYKNKNKERLLEIKQEANKILDLYFMRSSRFRYYKKLLVFNLKRPLFLLNILPN